MTIKIADVAEVLTEETDDVISDWYEQAVSVDSFDALQKLLNTVFSRFVHTPATTPHAYIVSALAALKFVDGSEQGNLNKETWQEVMFGLIQILSGEVDSPVGIVKYSSLMKPDGDKSVKIIPKKAWDWMQETAKISLVHPENENASSEFKAHWTDIAKGEIPFGFRVI